MRQRDIERAINKEKGKRRKTQQRENVQKEKDKKERDKGRKEEKRQTGEIQQEGRRGDTTKESITRKIKDN